MRLLRLVPFLALLSGCLIGAAEPTDHDGDGYYGVDCNLEKNCDPTTDAEDCNDEDPNVNPDVNEECGDNVDNDCDGNTDEDCEDTTS